MKRFPVSALRSVALNVPDLAAAEQFYTSIWALDVADRGRDTVYLRATGDDHHVLALHLGDRPQLRSVTFRAASADDLERVATAAAVHGCRILSGPSRNDDPDGGTALAIRDPRSAIRELRGGVLRFVYGDRQHPDARMVGGRPFRLAHVNVNSSDVAATVSFYDCLLYTSPSPRDS